MTSRTFIASLVTAALALVVTVSVSAGSPPVLLLDMGKTGTISGPYTDGGLSVGAAVMWRVDEMPWSLPARFGVMGIADDMGSTIGDLTTGSGTPIGTTTLGHQAVYGAAFRLDWEPEWSAVWKSYASGTWGYYRVVDDVRGEVTGGVSAPGFSLAAGFARRAASGHSLGLVVRYHRLFDDVTGRYVSGAVEYGWRAAH